MAFESVGGYQELAGIVGEAERLRKEGYDADFRDTHPLSRADGFQIPVVPGEYQLREARIDATAETTGTDEVVPVIVVTRFSINDMGLFLLSMLAPKPGQDYTNQQMEAFADKQVVTSMGTWEFRKEMFQRERFEGIRGFQAILDDHLWDIEGITEGYTIKIDKAIAANT